MPTSYLKKNKHLYSTITINLIKYSHPNLLTSLLNQNFSLNPKTHFKLIMLLIPNSIAKFPLKISPLFLKILLIIHISYLIIKVIGQRSNPGNYLFHLYS
jgi:hypothetical protein